MPVRFPPGLYEQLVTDELRAALESLDSTLWTSDTASIDPAETASVLARHLEAVLRQVLENIPADRRQQGQLGLCNELVQFLAGRFPRAALEGSRVPPPPSELRSIARQFVATPKPQAVPRPTIPLASSDLLVNARGEPGVGHALEREIPSADRIDLLCAFVRWNGLRLLESQLRAHCEQGRPLRVITTTYTGSTERRALDRLVEMGADVRVSYDTRSTRLHAKAWLFHRETGFSTGYVGSSNLSRAALVDGVEWNVRLSQVASPHLLEKFRATFDTYWEDPEYEAYDPGRDADRFDRAVAASPAAEPLQFLHLDVTPYPHQQEILDRLQVERERHGRSRTLVVAATGTGKTIVSALDYRRLQQPMGNPSLLFVAHRKELLEQSLQAFRVALRDGAFGELYVDGHRPDEWRHVFASIQSLSTIDLANLSPTAFDIVIVDEFHHAAAPTYRRLLEHLRPQVLVGLTATPERADGVSVLEWFDGRIAIELRLWEALERGLLCPFQYFGLHDTVDLSSVSWSRRGYDVSELENLYTGHHARVRLVVQAIRDKVADPSSMRALGFCVSIAHANFMAAEFNRYGIPSLAVSANTSRDDRDVALRRLRDGDVNVVFAVDLFNEGIDVPGIDTVLFLRPTESATVFLQQLGRGLRHTEGKDCLTVLDFIGKAHRRFRYDRGYQALTGQSRAGAREQIEQGFPTLPPGCRIQLDRVARDIVLENVRTAVGGTFALLVDELRSMPPDTLLPAFIEHAGIEVEDVYRGQDWSWTRLKRAAGLTTAAAGSDDTILLKGVRRLLHTDDRERIALLREWCREPKPPDLAGLGNRQRRVLEGLHFVLRGRRSRFHTLDESLADVWAHPALVGEMGELLALLEDRATHIGHSLDAEHGWSRDISLQVHARYGLDEVLTAIGYQSVTRERSFREGVLYHEPIHTDLFFVTLEKSERHYSPSTMYRDYAISPRLFHWESQSTTGEHSPTGQRYIHHRQRGSRVLLFVRRTRRVQGARTAPYTFLGVADYVSHRGERPMAITWRLRRPMPADFFREAKLAAG